jgi:hypothetical protein
MFFFPLYGARASGHVNWIIAIIAVALENFLDYATLGRSHVRGFFNPRLIFVLFLAFFSISAVLANFVNYRNNYPNHAS